MTRFFVGVAVVAVALVSGLAIQAVFVAESTSAPPHLQAANAAANFGTPPAALTGWPEGTAQWIADLEAWVTGVHHAEWIAGVEREQERLAVEEAERLAATRAAANERVARPRADGTTVGECTGFAIPDYIIRAESGGDANAVNPSSGAYGCAQVMPFHWDGGACSALDRYSIEGQRECVRRLSSDGTNLAPWAATR